MDSGKRDPWKLCTVTQVEEIKSILRLLPIWHCTILYSVVFTQMASMFVVQGRRNARHDAHHRLHADCAVRSVSL
jgi:dipeptide/tripeptide permease